MFMPGAAPTILSPGRGPNGPGPIDARKPIASVGIGTSSVPYGPTNGYAAFNTGATGFIGPPVSSLVVPTSWYVRAVGSNNNGGSSASTTPDRTGTDGSTTSGSLTFTSASGAFTPADIGKGICIQNATFCYAKIVAINSSTSVQLSNPPSATAGSLSWAIGGAWADPRPFLNCTSFANTTCGVQAGDTVYVGAGTYRQVYALGANYGGLWNATGGTVKKTFDNFNGQVNIVGDVDGSHTGDAGMVQLTAYTTNDKTAPSATTLLNLNGKSNLAFSNIMFVGGNAILLTATTATSQNITFRDCTLLHDFPANVATISATCAYATQFNWLFDRCVIRMNTTASRVTTITVTTGNGPDYDINFNVTNSQYVAPFPAIIASNSGTLTGKGNGVRMRRSFSIGGLQTTAASQMSVIFPTIVEGCVIGGLNAATLGQIVESYNLILGASTPRTNVNVGTGSIADGSYASLYHFGQESQWGGLIRRFGEPMAGSPLLGFGSQDPALPVDLRGYPRPAGGGSPLSAVGAFERANTSARASVPAPPSGTYVWQITGPGYQDFVLPVDTTATTISCTVQRDSAYSDPHGLMPSLEVLAAGNIGVSAAVVYDTGGSGSNNTLTLPTFTPTGIGPVTVRIRSYDQTGVSLVSFSVFTII